MSRDCLACRRSLRICARSRQLRKKQERRDWTLRVWSAGCSSGQEAYSVAILICDALAYYWDFGDGTFGTNGPAASQSWTASGEYVVRCVVSDMKGGVASDSVIVTVDNPGTYRVSGRVSVGGVPVEGVRLSVSSRQMTYTDSDGTAKVDHASSGEATIFVDGSETRKMRAPGWATVTIK